MITLDSILEVFDSIESRIKTRRKEYIEEYEFEVDNNSYGVRIMRFTDNGSYDILFFKKEGNQEVTSLTNIGKGTFVLGGVMDAIRKFISKHKPKMFQFEAFGNKRIRLYDRLIKLYVPKEYKATKRDMKELNGIRYTFEMVQSI